MVRVGRSATQAVRGEVIDLNLICIIVRACLVLERLHYDVAQLRDGWLQTATTTKKKSKLLEPTYETDERQQKSEDRAARQRFRNLHFCSTTIVVAGRACMRMYFMKFAPGWCYLPGLFSFFTVPGVHRTGRVWPSVLCSFRCKTCRVRRKRCPYL